MDRTSSLRYRPDDAGQLPSALVVPGAYPFGKTPAFRNAGFELYETSAINVYYCESMIRRYVLQYLFPSGSDGKPDRGIIEAALGDIRKHLAVIERACNGRDFLSGDRAWRADLLMAPVLFYVAAMPEGAALLHPCPNIRRARATMAERDSFKATIPALG